MKESIIVAVGLAIAAVAISCGHPTPTTADEKPQASITWPSARPEDEQLLDEYAAGLARGLPGPGMTPARPIFL